MIYLYLIGAIICFMIFLYGNITGFLWGIFFILLIIIEIKTKNNTSQKKETAQIKDKKEDIKLSSKSSNNISNSKKLCGKLMSYLYLIGAGIGFVVFLYGNIAGFLWGMVFLFLIVVDIISKNDKDNTSQKKEIVQIKDKKEDIKLSSKSSNNISNSKVLDNLYSYDFPIPTRYSLSNEEQSLVQKAVFYKRERNYFATEEIYIDIYNRYGASVALYVSIAKVMICQGMFKNALKLMNLSLIGVKNILGRNDNIIDEHCETLTNIITNNISTADIYLYLTQISGNSNYQPILRENADEQMKKIFTEVFDYYQSQLYKDLVINSEKENISLISNSNSINTVKEKTKKVSKTKLEDPDDLYSYDFPVPIRYSLNNDTEKVMVKEAISNGRNKKYFPAEKMYINVYNQYGASVALYVLIAKIMICQGIFKEASELIKLAMIGTKNILGEDDIVLKNHYNILINIVKGALSIEAIYLYLIKVSENLDYQPILREYSDEKTKNIFNEISKNLKYYQSKINKDLIKKYENENINFNKRLGIVVMHPKS